MRFFSFGVETNDEEYLKEIKEEYLGRLLLDKCVQKVVEVNAEILAKTGPVLTLVFSQQPLNFIFSKCYTLK